MSIECLTKIMLLLLTGILVLTSCNKEQAETLDSRYVETGIRARINDIEIINDSLWVACAGNRETNGYFLQSDDQGESWNYTITQFPRSVYCMNFLPEGFGIAGGDFLDLWTTNDFGRSWNYYWLGNQVPMHEQDRPGVRDIMLLNDSIWTFCGGEHLGEGVLYRTTNSGQDWNFSIYQNEFRGTVLNDKEEVVTAGHGKIISYKNDLSEAKSSEFSNGFVTSMIKAADNTLLACTSEGKIINSEDGGMQWNERFDINRYLRRRINWNDLVCEGAKCCCCGTQGHLITSNDHGKTWRTHRINEEKNLVSVVMKNERIIAGDSEGNIHFMFMPD